MQTAQRNNLVKILSEREDFLVIGLTGRIGSGCSEAANIFCSDIQKIQLPSIYPGDRGLQDDVQRDRRIIVRYYTAHWMPFDRIQVRTIITTFLIKNMSGFVKDMSALLGKNDDKIEKELKRGFCQKLYEDGSKFDLEKVNKTLLGELKEDEGQQLYDKIRLSYEQLDSKVEFAPLEKIIDTVSVILQKLYEKEVTYENRQNYYNTVNYVLYGFSAKIASRFIQCLKQDKLWIKLSNINDQLEVEKISQTEPSNCKKNIRVRNFKRFMFAHDIMPALAETVHNQLTTATSTKFTELFQKYGNCIRRFGEIIYDNGEIKRRLSTAQNNDTFAIPRKINQFIKVLRHPVNRNVNRPTRVVIDSIKNNFEATYLRDRYSAFYLFAVSVNEAVRINRLMERPQRRLNLEQIHHIDWNEYSSVGYDIFKRQRIQDQLSEEEKSFLQKINSEGEVLSDLVRKNAYENGTHQFLLQDVESCIQNADVFIRNEEDGHMRHKNLKWEIVRYVSLMLYPGLVQPTPIERCMQIAFTAKVNSGCLSRQVGAVVTDANFNILSIGWNDVPCGDISCSRKNLIDLCKLEDESAYTAYELTNSSFRKRLDRFKKEYIDSKNISRLLCGLPLRYCFKDIHIDTKNPMRSRAMHGEEKALAACGRQCEGGYLFTTSSPCEMCSKNAKDHKIKRIYYIEPYPGISEDQYSRSGEPDNIAQHILFSGAIGRAYSQMYTPFMPHKDILAFLGIRFKGDD